MNAIKKQVDCGD